MGGGRGGGGVEGIERGCEGEIGAERIEERCYISLAAL